MIYPYYEWNKYLGFILIVLNQLKSFVLLYFSRQFIFFVFAGGLSALLNILIRIVLRLYFDIIISAIVAGIIASLCAFSLHHKFVFPYSAIPINIQAKRFILMQIGFMPFVVTIFYLLSNLFSAIGMGVYSEPIAHVISIGMPALITFLLYKLFVFSE